ncbi:MAG TPA: CHAD domain-containing protein, partial [Planctomycetota bacterium]|nr:CHAD domain-containing protein [Planctomycetota bacterium]
LEQARAAAERRQDPTDHKALHDFRVAIRRLRSALRVWKSELGRGSRAKDRRRLRQIQRSTNAGRDAEVGLGWLAQQVESLSAEEQPGLHRIAQRLETRLESTDGDARERVDDDFPKLQRRLKPRLSSLRVEVNLARPTEGARFGEAWADKLREHAAELAERLAEVDSPSNREPAHAARIRLKRLRYLAEPAASSVAGVKELVATCKRLQDVLGDFNDAHVLGVELEEALEGADDGAPEQPGLAELARRVEARREELFVTLEREWLGESGGGAALCASAGRLADAGFDAARAGTEVERKFLLSELPPLPRGATLHEIEQGWLPGKLLRERVRAVRDDDGEHFFRTLKLGRGLSRTEIEEETTREVFDALWPLSAGCRVRKVRHEVHDDDLVWEIDEFRGRELVLAEVELGSTSDLAVPPAWLAPFVVREVTDEPGYTNLELAN